MTLRAAFEGLDAYRAQPAAHGVHGQMVKAGTLTS